MRPETSKEAPAMASNQAANNNNGKEKKEVMQSNLPLLFANGSPISLESMNLVSSEKFRVISRFFDHLPRKTLV